MSKSDILTGFQRIPNLVLTQTPKELGGRSYSCHSDLVGETDEWAAPFPVDSTTGLLKAETTHLPLTLSNFMPGLTLHFWMLLGHAYCYRWKTMVYS